MADGGIMGLAWRHNRWLAERQVAIASNIANINTPRYQARDTPPFELTNRANAVHAAHMRLDQSSFRAFVDHPEQQAGRVHSGNTLGLEHQLATLADTHQSYAMNAGAIRAFHRMIMASSKG